VLARPGCSTGRAMLDAALIGGAQALARPSGRLAVGARADLLTLKADHPTLAGKAGDAILDAWIFSAGNALIDCVWSGGRKVVQDGRHASRERIAARFAATMRRLSAL
jgi:formimidoylglutamate deiminase